MVRLCCTLTTCVLCSLGEEDCTFRNRQGLQKPGYAACDVLRVSVPAGQCWQRPWQRQRHQHRPSGRSCSSSTTACRCAGCSVLDNDVGLCTMWACGPCSNCNASDTGFTCRTQHQRSALVLKQGLCRAAKVALINVLQRVFKNLFGCVATYLPVQPLVTPFFFLFSVLSQAEVQQLRAQLAAKEQQLADAAAAVTAADEQIASLAAAFADEEARVAAAAADLAAAEAAVVAAASGAADSAAAAATAAQAVEAQQLQMQQEVSRVLNTACC